MRNLVITFILLLSTVLVVLYTNYTHHERIEKIISGQAFVYSVPDVIIDPLFDPIPY
jgi:hypothetical protein